MTSDTCCTSRPLPHTSVAISTRDLRAPTKSAILPFSLHTHFPTISRDTSAAKQSIHLYFRIWLALLNHGLNRHSHIDSSFVTSPLLLTPQCFRRRKIVYLYEKEICCQNSTTVCKPAQLTITPPGSGSIASITMPRHVSCNVTGFSGDA